MKFLAIIFALIIVNSCSDGLRDNPVDPNSENSIIGSLGGNIIPQNSNSAVKLLQGTEKISETNTDQTGNFLFEYLKEGSYNITIESNDYNTLSLFDIRVFSKRENDIGTIILSPKNPGDTTAPRAIFGRVFESKNITPLEGVRIRALGPEVYETFTDINGSYNILEIDSGLYNITAEKEGFLLATMSVQVKNTGGSEANFSLSAVGVVKGKVTDLTSGNPLENVLVQITGFSAYTNATGEYYIQGMPDPITTSVNFSLPEYLTYNETITISPGAVKVVDVALTKYGVIFGKVTNTLNNQPISGISVLSNLSVSTTDVLGNYEVYCIPGNNTIKFFGQGFVTKEIPNINLTAGERRELNTSLEPQANAPTGTISGIIRDKLSGQPISFVENTNLFYLYDPDMLTFYGVTNDSIVQGNYSFINWESNTPRYLTPNFLQGEYRIWSWSHSFLIQNNYLSADTLITVTAGTNTVNIDLVKGAKVLGRVYNSLTNQPVGNATLNIGNVSASTNADGFYELKRVNPRETVLTTSAAGYYNSEEIVSLISNETTYKEIYLTPKPSIYGTVVDSISGIPLGDVIVQMEQRTTYTNNQGTYLLSNLDEGTKILSFAKVGYKSYVTSIYIPYSGDIQINVRLVEN